MPNDSWFKRNRATYESAKAILQADFPELFDSADPKPLAIGMRRELYAHYAGKPGPVPNIVAFLGFWCHRREYIRALAAASALRRSLDGTTRRVSPLHVRHAAEVAREIERLETDCLQAEGYLRGGA